MYWRHKLRLTFIATHLPAIWTSKHSVLPTEILPKPSNTAAKPLWASSLTEDKIESKLKDLDSSIDPLFISVTEDTEYLNWNVCSVFGRERDAGRLHIRQCLVGVECLVPRSTALPLPVAVEL